MARTAIWRSIADTLGAEIAAGGWRPGDRLPTEAQLSARFDVNRHTVRRALASLAGAGAVVARRGSGVYVATVPTDYPLGRRVRFHRNVLASGQTPSRRLASVETRAADAAEARALGLAPGEPVHVATGVSLADGRPIAAFRSVFPATRLPDLPEALRATDSVTRALAACGVADHIRASTRLTAVAADAIQARHMGLAEGAPLLRSVGVNTDAAGRPVEYGTTWFAGDRVTLTLAGDQAP